MEGPRNLSLLPVISYARVVGYDPSNHAVYVQLPSLQSVSLPAKVLCPSTADAVRVEQFPLPVIGTKGLVAFTGGDTMSAVWLGSFYASEMNAITTSNPPTDQDSQMKYMAHASGAWELLDYVGNYHATFADTSTLDVNTTGQAPVTYVHQVDANTGAQNLVQYTQTQRNAYPPGPFWMKATSTRTGSSASISPSGTVFIQAGNPTQPSITMTSSGVYTLNTTPNGGQTQGPIVVFDAVKGMITITGQNGNSTITMDTPGNITLENNTGAILQVASDGNITLTAPGGDIGIITELFQTTIDIFFELFNNHVHSDVQSGQSDTGPPTQIVT